VDEIGRENRQKRTISIDLMYVTVKIWCCLSIAIVRTGLVLLLLGLSMPASAQFWSNNQVQLLPEEEAFSVVSSINDQAHLIVNWSIADDYYMYRDSLKIEAITNGVVIGEISFPQGVIEDDPEFGEVEVYFYNIELNAALGSSSQALPGGPIELILYGQGCNKPVGVCYPPMQRTVSLAAPEQLQAASASNVIAAAQVETNNSPFSAAPTNAELSKSFFAYVMAAFGAGILLSFTPCVLPMIPILAGVIAGQGTTTKMQSGMLAVCYVAGTIVTYIIAGALAGATGAQLQAYFQNIWVIGFICCLLILLAASLFGWFKIQLPSSLQTRLQTTSTSSKSASMSSFGLGLISALVVGACVSPVLILALGAAITKGDPVLGAAIMGAMATGMGLLLILFGFGAGWILPKAGPWMNQVQKLFGLMVLGVAVYLIDILGVFPGLYLWAALLLVSGFFLWNIATQINSDIFKSGVKAVSAATIGWGLMALVGASLNGVSILNPLENLGNGGSSNQQQSVEFAVTTQLSEVVTMLEQAKQSEQAVLVDFYADWCLDCKRMDRSTYQEAEVINSLANWSRIKIDVTETNQDSEELKRFFSVFGPPATVFIRPNGTEYQGLRQYGYLDKENFLQLINRANGA